jgi:hypothetical protein
MLSTLGRSVKKTAGILSLAMLIMILAASSQFASAQFIPCRIVNLNLIPPTLVEAGQPFQVTSNLTISCDPSVLPLIRADLVDTGTSKILSTTSLQYYAYSSSFMVSVVNQATAHGSIGGWALQVQVYVINAINGYSVASTSQLFHVTVEPYTPPSSSSQTIATSTQTLMTSVSVQTQSLSPTTNQAVIKVAVSSAQLVPNIQAEENPVVPLLIPAAIVLLGVGIFGSLVYAGRRRAAQPST